MKGFLLSVLMLLTSLSAFSSQELPLEYFIKHGDYLDLALSPSGKHIAARVQVDGRVFLVLLKTGLLLEELDRRTTTLYIRSIG